MMATATSSRSDSQLQRIVSNAELACYARRDPIARRACSGDVCRWENLRVLYERHIKRGGRVAAADCGGSGRSHQEPIAPIFAPSDTPLRVLFVEDFWPHSRAVWRLNEARAFIERYETGASASGDEAGETGKGRALGSPVLICKGCHRCADVPSAT